MSERQSLAFHEQKFASAAEKNFVPKFTDRISWTMYKICKYKVFLWAKFSRICTESKDITGKYVSEKTPIFAYFTQCFTYFTYYPRNLLIIEREW